MKRTISKSVKPLVFVSESEEVEQPASIITSKEIITHNNSLYGLSDFEIVRFILFLIPAVYSKLLLRGVRIPPGEPFHSQDVISYEDDVGGK